MIHKNNEKGKCPFRKLKPCSEECAFYRKGVRYKENSDEAFPFEDCAINIIADNLEAMHNRTYMMQKEVGETKNIIAINILSDVMSNIPKEEVARQALKTLGIKSGDTVAGTKVEIDGPKTKKIEE